MLLVPLVTGAAAGNPHGERIIWILLFAAVALGLFFLRTPVEAALGFSPLRPQNDGERRLVHSFIYIYSSVSVLALALLMLWAHAYGLLAVRRSRGDGFSSSGGVETTRPGNPHERPIDGGRRAAAPLRRELITWRRVISAPWPSSSGWPTGFSPPTRYISFSFEFIPRGPRRPGKNCAKAGASCFTKASPCCFWD